MKRNHIFSTCHRFLMKENFISFATDPARRFETLAKKSKKRYNKDSVYL